MFVEETHDVILVWNYTLDGTVALAKFWNTAGGVNDEIARQFQGSTTVYSSYQERFRANITDTHARLTILKVQRSDQGKYEVDLTASVSGTLRHTVELIVQCKYSVRQCTCRLNTGQYCYTVQCPKYCTLLTISRLSLSK